METYMALLQQHYLLGRQQAILEAQAMAMVRGQQLQVRGLIGAIQRIVSMLFREKWDSKAALVNNLSRRVSKSCAWCIIYLSMRSPASLSSGRALQCATPIGPGPAPGAGAGESRDLCVCPVHDSAASKTVSEAIVHAHPVHPGQPHNRGVNAHARAKPTAKHAFQRPGPAAEEYPGNVEFWQQLESCPPRHYWLS
jgi:hypothetical protein